MATNRLPHRSTTYRRVLRAAAARDSEEMVSGDSNSPTDFDLVGRVASQEPLDANVEDEHQCGQSTMDHDDYQWMESNSVAGKDDHGSDISESDSDDDDCEVSRFSDLSLEDEPDFFGNNSLYPEDEIPLDEDIMETIKRPSLSLTVKIAAIAIFFNLSNPVVNAFLALFRFLNFDVPKDARTIKKTPRNGPQSTDFAHFGLARGIQRKCGQRWTGKASKEILLQLNMDGIPLFKNSRIQFWPILCKIVNGPDRNPFVVSVYCGVSKPPSLSEYLSPFIGEMTEIEKNGLRIGERHCTVRIESIICDAPARSFVKAIIGHNGVKGCERCSQTGKSINNRTAFTKVDGVRLRDNNSFRRQQDKNHHKGYSPFLNLNVDMVRQFPIEYMHMVCLGVMKRLLNIWVNDRSNGLKADQIAEMDQRITQYKQNYPKEFNRKGRNLIDLPRWKATEYRAFLLYSGPLILKDMLPADKYDHFMVFHTCIRILLSPSSRTAEYEFAGQWLKYFVDHFGHLYGTHHLVYNVHSLIHIADDCIYFQGSLDKFSAFPFENFLGKMKRLLRGSRKPMAQLYKRLIEIENQEVFSKVQSKNKYSDGSISSIIKSYSSHSRADSFCLIEKGVAIQIIDINERFVRGCPLILAKKPDESFINFSEKAVKSSELDIYVVNGKERQTVTYPISAMTNSTKGILMPFTNAYEEKSHLFIPILHQEF